MSQYIEALKSAKNSIVLPMTQEIMRSLPESTFLGVGIMSLITQSYPTAILFLAMIELGIIQNLIAKVSGFLSGEVRGEIPLACLSGLPNQNSLGLLKLLMNQSAFPSASMFFIAGILTYSMISVSNFKPELKTLGQKEPEWNTRLPIALIFGILFILLFAAYRLYNECEGVVGLLGSIVFGMIFGSILSILHLYLFGRDSINLLGLPLLADRAADGSPLYACATT